MLKDALLIDAAVQGDAIVVSLDDAARRSFAELAHGGLRVLQGILWIDPSRENFVAIDQKGTPISLSRWRAQ
jgi:hypothetical protein